LNLSLRQSTANLSDSVQTANQLESGEPGGQSGPLVESESATLEVRDISEAAQLEIKANHGMAAAAQRKRRNW
jgi:hypothetical protein